MLWQRISYFVPHRFRSNKDVFSWPRPWITVDGSYDYFTYLS